MAGDEAPPFRTWNDLATATFPRPPWLIEEFIPAEGIVLIWGHSSVGKTPIAWHMARAIACGTPFAGAYHTIQAPVLFLELDQPEIVTAGRIKRLPLLPGNPPLVFEHLNPLSYPLTEAERGRLEFLRDACAPGVVFVDTLRKAHPLDDTASDTVQKVYKQFRDLFPGAALVFVHHQRKTHHEHPGPLDESFSGAQAWKNDAQIGFHAEVHHPTRTIRLTCRKNQLGELDWSVRFRLVDGVDLQTENDAKEVIREIIATVEERARTAAVMERLGMSERTARRKLREAGG